MNCALKDEIILFTDGNNLNEANTNKPIVGI